MDSIKEFETERKNAINDMAKNRNLRTLTHNWFIGALRHKYPYNFKWLDRPIIQFPQDIIAMQEIIWSVKPDLIIETGIAHGGSLIFYASMLELIGGDGQVLGIDINIREHNRVAIEKHPMFKRIVMVEGSSVEDEVVKRVYEFAKVKKRVLVALDSDHAHKHVFRELELYSPLVTKDSYLVVFDTVIEDMPKNYFPNRPWSKGDNPRTAVREFLKINNCFKIDGEITDKLLITAAPDGYLKRIKD